MASTIGLIILLLVISMQIEPSTAGQGCFKQMDYDFYARDERDNDFGNPPPKSAGVATDQDTRSPVGVASLSIPGYEPRHSDIIIGPFGKLRGGMCVHFEIGYRGKQTLDTSADSATIEAVHNLNCRIGRQNVQKVSIARLSHKIEFSPNVQAAFLPFVLLGDDGVAVSNIGFTGSVVVKAQRETSKGISFSTFHKEDVHVVDKSNCAPVEDHAFLESHSICIARTGASTSTGQTSNAFSKLDNAPLISDFQIGDNRVPAVYAMQYGSNIGNENTGDWYFPSSACKGNMLTIMQQIRSFSKIFNGIDQPRS